MKRKGVRMKRSVLCCCSALLLAVFSSPALADQVCSDPTSCWDSVTHVPVSYTPYSGPAWAGDIAYGHPLTSSPQTCTDPMNCYDTRTGGYVPVVDLSSSGIGASVQALSVPRLQTPVPPAALLFASGLAGLLFVRRRK